MSALSRSSVCPACGEELRAGCVSWVAQCRRCGISIDCAPVPGEISIQLDEVRRVSALSRLRSAAARRMLDRILAKNPSGGRRLLDIGCGHGWFLSAAAARGFDATGIEPDEKAAKHALALGVAVRQGRFPDVMSPGETFDVIAFNDVIEHLPDPLESLFVSRSHLTPGGIIVVSIPVTNGCFYRTSRLLAHVGWRAPLERLWQRRFPSPHTHYFSRKGFERMAERAGLNVVQSWRKPSISIRGLWDRLHFGGDPNPKWLLPAIWGTLILLFPIILMLPGDTVDFALQAGESSKKP